MDETESFESIDWRPRAEGADALVLNIDGFEGPLDLLLMLARAQKVDLERISILELAEQYLAFVDEARQKRLELAADYLVMAAWLAYLKSRLLLPEDDEEGEPSAEEMALRLQLALQRLEAMRDVAAQLMNRDRLGRDVFARGNPEGLKADRRANYDVTLYELLRAYADNRIRHSVTEIKIRRRPVYSLEDALHRLNEMVGAAVSWTALEEFLPDSAAANRIFGRSARASMFTASLELARQGRVQLRQLETYGPLYLRLNENDSDEQ